MLTLTLPYLYGSIHAKKPICFGYVARGGGLAYLMNCRDSFHAMFRPEKCCMLFRQGPDTKDFIDQIETRLNLDAAQKIEWRKTSHPEWLEVEPNWWLKDVMRFSLLTILLRASLSYKDLDAAMKGCRQLSITASAVERFMAGNTCFKPPASWVKRGWVAAFKKPSFTASSRALLPHKATAHAERLSWLVSDSSLKVIPPLPNLPPNPVGQLTPLGQLND